MLLVCKQLDNWAEYLLKNLTDETTHEEIGTFKYGYRKGYAEGIRKAVSIYHS